jgi:hypothetical protein
MGIVDIFGKKHSQFDEECGIEYKNKRIIVVMATMTKISTTNIL